MNLFSRILIRRWTPALGVDKRMGPGTSARAFRRTAKMTINTTPADRALTASDRYVFGKPAERAEILRAKSFFFRAGGVVTRYLPGTNLPEYTFTEGRRRLSTDALPPRRIAK